MDLSLILPFLSGTISDFAVKYPVIAAVLVVVGIARSINKPLFAFAKALVAATPSPADDAFVGKVETSKLYKTVSFVLDWTLSIKLPEKK